MTRDLPIIQKTYDLIVWYVPLLNRLPRDHKFAIGERIVAGLYDLLEDLIRARYAPEKLAILEGINARLDVLRYQTRILHQLDLMATNRYEYVSTAINAIGTELGGWIKHQNRGRTS
jgi:hypothetical protein